MRAVASGRLSLDLTWTLRLRDVRPTETLKTPEDLSLWLAEAVLDEPPVCGATELQQARSLREAVYRAALAVATGGRPTQADGAVVNAWAARPVPYPQLDLDGGARLLADPDSAALAALAAVARDAVAILASRDGRLRLCEGPHCALLFHDASAPGARRWCSTARCGNRANTSAYRRRRSTPDPGGGGARG